MKEKLIYEKKYPPIDYMEQHERNRAEVKNNTDTEELSTHNFFQGIRANTQYMPIPKRIEEGEAFIKEAIEVSKLYQMDAKIIRLDEKISAHLSFDFGANMQYISRLFGMADRVSFFKDQSKHDATVCLDFYTHVVVRNGIAVAP